MDPDCAICYAPATRACDCEANSLETAIRQAEARAMQSVFDEIRAWVKGHAQDYILEYFKQLADRRTEAHTIHMDRITQHAYHVYNARPNPHDLEAAQAALRRGINDDWQSSVHRYPEVLQYFYNLIHWTVPADDDPAVRDPPLSALQRERPPAGKRRGGALGGGGSTPPTMGSASMHYERDYGGRRTSPVLVSSRGDRRTPGPPDRRMYVRPPPPHYHPAAGGYYGSSSYHG